MPSLCPRAGTSSTPTPDTTYRAVGAPRSRQQQPTLVPGGMPLGLMPQMSYEEQETALVPGEGVLFYTDGLIEAHNPKGEMLGTPRLRNLLSERHEDGIDLTAALIEELEYFTGEGWEQEDDITLLTLERSGAQS